MRLFAIFACMILALSFCHVDPVWSAARTAPAKQQKNYPKAGETVSTKFFSVKLPAGWEMPMPIHNMPDGLSALFANPTGDLAVTINVLESGLSPKELAQRTVANMRKSGLRPTDPKEFNGMWRIGIKGKVEGEAWFTASGALKSATVILGPNLKKINELLKALKPVSPGLFPEKI